MTDLAYTFKLPDDTELKLLDKIGPNNPIPDPTFGGFLTGILDIVLLITLVLMFIWMVWGIFQYIFAGGDKERLAKARSRLTWAIVGFSIVILALTLQKYAREIFPPKDIPVTPITAP